MYLNYKEYGSGEPIVILHGLLGMLDNWHSFAKKLSEEFWVIAVDQRNHGKSFHSNDFNYALLADDVNKLLSELGIPRCHILGHSMGGKTVMQYLEDYNDTIEKAIIIDISPKEYKGGHELIFESLLNIDLNSISSRKEVQTQLSLTIDNLGTVLFLMKNLSRKKDGSFEWKANIENLWQNYNNIKGNVAFSYQIDTPVLFIKGQQSNYITTEDLKIIQNQFEEAEIVEIPEAGHWVHADQPDILLEHVKKFLKA